ncbi:hypothetical protein FACS189446_7680 [Bacteroidia bacterium]|nr:hypothetical protein FACS189446_7680 [Bacteroidia bacterium]
MDRLRLQVIKETERDGAIYYDCTARNISGGVFINRSNLVVLSVCKRTKQDDQKD